MSKDKTNIEEITPKEIYLQAFTDDGLSYKDAGEEVTWCEDKVSDEDIKYIREDQVQAECDYLICTTCGKLALHNLGAAVHLNTGVSMFCWGGSGKENYVPISEYLEMIKKEQRGKDDK